MTDLGTTGPDAVRNLYAATVWQSRVGSVWHQNPGVAALISIRAQTRARPRWRLQHPATAEWWQPPGIINDIRWRDPAADPNVATVHHFDMRRAYLAAAAAVMLPHGQLHRNDLADDTGQVGYFRVLIANRRLRDLLGPRGVAGPVWVTHAALDVLRHRGIGAEIVEAWVQRGESRQGRILRPWAEHWRTVMDAWPEKRDVLKQGYAQALGGLFATPGGSVYRPDWRHMIIDQVRASILRRVLNAAPDWPMAVDVDSLYYQGHLSPVRIGDRIVVGERMGNMRYLGVEPREVWP